MQHKIQLVVTGTHAAKELEASGMLTRDQISYVGALEDGGCDEIAKRCLKKHIGAVFILDVSSILSKQFSMAKLQGLLEACDSSDTNICFNQEMVGIVFSQIIALGGKWTLFS